MNIFDMYRGAEELGMEEGLGGGEGGAEAVAEAVRAEVAEVAVQVEEQSQQIEELVESVNEMDESVEELAENVDGMEHLLASGNFNAQSFALLYNRSTKLAVKLDGKVPDYGRMGAESFSDAATAQMMARSGIEGFMDTVKSYGRKAIEFIKHIFNVVINFFVSLWSEADAIQRRCDQLKKRMEGEVNLKETIKLGAWNAYFDYKKNGLSDLDKNLLTGKLETAINDMMALAKNVQGIELSAFQSAYKEVVVGIKDACKLATKKVEKKQGSTDVVVAIINGIRVMFTYSDTEPKDLTEAATAARSIKIQVGKDTEAKKLVTGEMKPKLKKQDLLEVVSKVRGGVAKLRTSDVAKKFSAAERDRVVGSLNAVKAGDSDKATEINKQINLVRAICAVSANLAQVTSKSTASCLRAALDGVQAHLGY